MEIDSSAIRLRVTEQGVQTRSGSSQSNITHPKIKSKRRYSRTSLSDIDQIKLKGLFDEEQDSMPCIQGAGNSSFTDGYEMNDDHPKEDADPPIEQGRPRIEPPPNSLRTLQNENTW